MKDADIRRALLLEMKREHGDDPNTVIIDELGLCEGIARVDVAVVNGSIHGYEIKSERDTLERLPGQRDVYNKALDRVTIVTSARHLRKIRRLIPRWWGIAIADASENGVRLRTVREPRDNPQPDMFAQVQLLWRDEALKELEERALSHGLRSKNRRTLWQKLAANVAPSDLGAVIRAKLKLRTRAVAQQASRDDSYQPSST